MTIFEFVKQYFPDVRSAAEARSLLWGATCYPFGTHEMVVEQMEEMSKASGSDVERAIAKLLLFGIMIDGRLSMREKRALENLRELKVMPYTKEQVKRWTRDYFEGRGLEEFFLK